MSEKLVYRYAVSDSPPLCTVIITFRPFFMIFTGLWLRGTWRLKHVEQELLALQADLSSTPIFDRVGITHLYLFVFVHFVYCLFLSLFYSFFIYSSLFILYLFIFLSRLDIFCIFCPGIGQKTTSIAIPIPGHATVLPSGFFFVSMVSSYHEYSWHTAKNILIYEMWM